jgi:5-dehydro-2-deoxygluconokinase
MPDLDVITMGRSSVDLYGEQVGGRLEDMASFRKYVGGSPTNMATGGARLGLRTGLITGVGDEPLGRFLREELAREGVDDGGIKVDPDRLTALVVLGIRDDHQFPLVFYRENCADMGLRPEDIDPAYVARAAAVVSTGTHWSEPGVAAASQRLLELAGAQGARRVLDIDYRPNLWGVAGHGDGESRFVPSEEVTTRLQGILPGFDLIVGTEEEFHIAGGTESTVAALREVRRHTAATLVCKRGALGSVALPGDIPDSLDDGVVGSGFAVEVFNVLGAGDGFMAGLLRGWLRGEDWPTSLTWANACGALAVSRHGCTPAYPSWEELRFFLDRGVPEPALRKDAALEQVHWSTTRRRAWPELGVFAFDHRSQFEAMEGATPERVGVFKELCLRATRRVAADRPGCGVLCDDRLGRRALREATGTDLWVGRPVEVPGSRPLRLEPEVGEAGEGLAAWPAGQVVKVLCCCHPGDPDDLWADQLATLSRVFRAARHRGLEFLLEVIPSAVGEVGPETVPEVLRQLYGAGLYPDWWKLEALGSAEAWRAVRETIEAHDPRTRGILVLGRDAPLEELGRNLQLAAREPLVRGFAVGRTVFGDMARAWLRGEASAEDCVRGMADRYEALWASWDKGRGKGERYHG